MSDNKKSKRECFLTEEQILFFMKANLIHTTDRGLIPLEMKDINLSIKKTVGNFKITVKGQKDNKKINFNVKVGVKAKSEEDHIRLMMFGTMELLQTLNDIVRKPILRIVK